MFGGLLDFAFGLGRAEARQYESARAAQYHALRQAAAEQGARMVADARGRTWRALYDFAMFEFGRMLAEHRYPESDPRYIRFDRDLNGQPIVAVDFRSAVLTMRLPRDLVRDLAYCNCRDAEAIDLIRIAWAEARREYYHRQRMAQCAQPPPIANPWMLVANPCRFEWAAAQDPQEFGGVDDGREMARATVTIHPQDIRAAYAQQQADAVVRDTDYALLRQEAMHRMAQLQMATITGIHEVGLGRFEPEDHARWLEEAEKSEKKRQEADARGRALLLANLSDEQRAELEQHNTFTVTGSATGRRYRIECRGGPYNVVELDKNGSQRGRLCFLPDGQLVTGDVVLAQKIALECDEDEALKVANVDYGSHGVWREMNELLREFPRCFAPGY